MGINKVMGYISVTSDNTGIFCDDNEDACVIAGSEPLLKSYIIQNNSFNEQGQKIKKTRYIDVEKGIEMGAKYLFDEISIANFKNVLEQRTLARKIDFIKMKKDWPGNVFYIVALKKS